MRAALYFAPPEEHPLSRAAADGLGRDAWRAGRPPVGSGEDALKGSPAPGKLADLVILSRDIFASPPTDIAETQVEATMFDGRFVFGGPESLG